MIRVVLCDPRRDFGDIDEYAERLRIPTVFGEEISHKLNKKRNDESRTLSLGALCALRGMIDSSERLEITTSENGKPLFIRSELPSFNISHSGLLASVAVSDQPVGVDIEEVKERKGAQKIAERFFSEGELNSLTENSSQARFYRIWTAKEALCKCEGLSLAQNLRVLDTLDAEESGEYFFSRYDVRFEDSQYIMTVCAKNKTDVEITAMNGGIKYDEIQN
ncbi:MAG: 4'-phosphopantetheinyl transferase superfamily protein [Ruminococcaceae bacterium]|nr:4'-phosphopantetheinyl transferase superfamily protein [Oscillospiraceae bacterium]